MAGGAVRVMNEVREAYGVVIPPFCRCAAAARLAKCRVTRQVPRHSPSAASLAKQLPKPPPHKSTQLDTGGRNTGPESCARAVVVARATSDLERSRRPALAGTL